GNLDGNFAEAFYVLADINMQKYKNNPLRHQVEGSRAIKYYAKVIEACPFYRNYETHYLLAEYYFNRKRYEDAKPFLETYVEKAKKEKNNNKLDEAAKRLDAVNTYIILLEK